ncbi:hypothetical protein [Variovorax sp. KBW07]|uniref:hypothetical protein n=1 Tax=Variovorax sp. KBW07 TaxID=2153358 RepID=UPI000F5678F6|nr:hypothetical protein [Variovorax sp. KBW07]
MRRIVAPDCWKYGSFRKLQKKEKPDEYPVLGMLLKHLVNKNQHFLTACAVSVRDRRSRRARQGAKHGTLPANQPCGIRLLPLP